MLLRPDTLSGIADGSIDLVFRRQRRPTVKAGGTLRTAIGVLAIDAVEPTTQRAITAEDVRRAGFRSRAELLAILRPPRDDDGTPRTLYRITVRLAGEDPRIALRNSSDLGDEDVAEIIRRLGRLDAASRHGPWTAHTLRAIAQNPGTRAPDLAASFGRETQPFKADVRKLKELGLTESLEVGYQLSPRGAAFLDRRRET